MTTQTDTALVLPQDVLQALALLSRLPTPVSDTRRGARAAWAYPVAGLFIGAVAALAGLTAHALGLPAALAALAALAGMVLSTGAMHEDGLADLADGAWGGWTRQQRLDIMRDSRIGAYGVIALVLGLAARWAALWLLFEVAATAAAAAIMAAAALSRAVMPALMAALPHARADGLSHGVGSARPATAAIALALGAVIALVFTGSGAIAAVIWAGGATLAVGAVARVKLGGQTGDILGAAQQLAEIAILFSLLA
jgi:adenosylcobinamide-GDP ribazoletransferase